MPLIEVIQPEDAQGELKEIYDNLVESRGKIAEVHKIQSLNPKSIVNHMDLYLTLLYGKSPLKRATRAKMSEAIDSIHMVFGFIGLEFMDAAFQPEVSGPFCNEMSMLNVLHAGVTLREETNEKLPKGEDVPLTYPDWLKNDWIAVIERNAKLCVLSKNGLTLQFVVGQKVGQDT